MKKNNKVFIGIIVAAILSLFTIIQLNKINDNGVKINEDVNTEEELQEEINNINKATIDKKIITKEEVLDLLARNYEESPEDIVLYNNLKKENDLIISWFNMNEKTAYVTKIGKDNNITKLFEEKLTDSEISLNKYETLDVLKLKTEKYIKENIQN